VSNRMGRAKRFMDLSWHGECGSGSRRAPVLFGDVRSTPNPVGMFRRKRDGSFHLGIVLALFVG
ncbi:MAG: hypothetical protein ACWGSQ_09620, partial [Longimicrobiales bacterium]